MNAKTQHPFEDIRELFARDSQFLIRTKRNFWRGDMLHSALTENSLNKEYSIPIKILSRMENKGILKKARFAPNGSSHVIAWHLVEGKRGPNFIARQLLKLRRLISRRNEG